MIAPAPLKECCEVLTGFAFKSNKFNTDKKGLPLIRIRDLAKGFSNTNYSGNYDAKFLVNKGDFLIGMDGEFKVYQWKSGQALLNQRVCKLIVNEKLASPKYIFYMISAKLKHIEDKTPFVTVKHISAKQILEIELALPPLDAQRKIVAVLEKAEQIKEKRIKSNEFSNEYLKSYFHELFGNTVTNSKKWGLEKLSALGTLERGKSKHRPRNDPILLGGKYPLIQTGDVANSAGKIKEYTQTYSEIGLKQSKLWPVGTLCITIAANIAFTGMLTFDACFPDSIVGFTPNKKCKVEYIQFWIGNLQKILAAQAPNSAQKNINLDILRNLDVPTPPIMLQEKFSKEVRRVEELKQKQQTVMVKSNLLFDSLMQKAFRGDLYA